MTNNTIISKINPTISQHHFTVDFYGRGGDVFLGQIPKSKASKRRDWNDRRLREMIKVETDKNTSGRLEPQLPKWAFSSKMQMFTGIDLTLPHDMIVKDQNGSVIYAASFGHDGLSFRSTDNRIIDIECLKKTKSYLYVQSTYPIHERFWSFSAKSFNLAELNVKAVMINGSRFIETLRQGVEPLNGGAQQYHEPKVVKIING